MNYLKFSIMTLLLVIVTAGDGNAQQPTGAIRPAGASSPAEVYGKITLAAGWEIQSSAKVKAAGEAISQTAFKPESWYPATMPSTVLAALVKNNVYPEPYFGMNLRAIPGCSYPIGNNFSNLPMPADSPFNTSWWFRTKFRLSRMASSNFNTSHEWLHFDGINFRANIWLNGHLIAKSDQVAGTFRLYEFDVSNLLQGGRDNVLAVEIFPPKEDDLALTWVDWNPSPPDKNMGIWREVYLSRSGPLTLRYPQVVTHFKAVDANGSVDLNAPELTVNAEVHNTTATEVDATIRGRLAGTEWSYPLTLKPDETRLVSITSKEVKGLNLAHPRLWWPLHLGEQNLYDLDLTLSTRDYVSDHQSVKFGIREITSELDDQKHRIFKVNGVRILIRGGGWSPDMLLRFNPERQDAEMRYVRDMNLNTIRLEGKLESDNLFELADRYGILVIAGWCCCDHWEHWPRWKPEDYTISAASLADQVRRLRRHPSLLVWLNGSDNPPPPAVEQAYIDVLKKNEWPNPYISSATQRATPVSGPTGVKMTGPYEWVPPVYWSHDQKLGGAHGFNTETSPGPAIPPIASLRKMLPEDHLWPIDNFWNYHAGGGPFKDVKVFTEAMNVRYGAAQNLADYVTRADVMAYDGERAMFEAYGANKYGSSGVIQWMLNNAWPSIIWHLYDYYLTPAGGYFGTKKACEPIHIQYSYEDRSVSVVNSTNQAANGLKALIKVYNLDLTEKFAREAALDLAPDSNKRIEVIPALDGLTTTYFVKLELRDNGGKVISSNLYWLSTKADVLKWDKTTFYVTPTVEHGDFTSLQNLPPAKLGVSMTSRRKRGRRVVTVKLTNPTKSLAFFIHAKIVGRRDGAEILPVLWDDNYISLMPGETRELVASYRIKNEGATGPALEVGGWNVPGVAISVQPSAISRKPIKSTP